jgi:hypothetical protein
MSTNSKHVSTNKVFKTQRGVARDARYVAQLGGEESSLEEMQQKAQRLRGLYEAREEILARLEKLRWEIIFYLKIRGTGIKERRAVLLVLLALLKSNETDPTDETIESDVDKLRLHVNTLHTTLRERIEEISRGNVTIDENGQLTCTTTNQGPITPPHIGPLPRVDEILNLVPTTTSENPVRNEIREARALIRSISPFNPEEAADTRRAFEEAALNYALNPCLRDFVWSFRPTGTGVELCEEIPLHEDGLSQYQGVARRVRDLVDHLIEEASATYTDLTTDRRAGYALPEEFFPEEGHVSTHVDQSIRTYQTAHAEYNRILISDQTDEVVFDEPRRRAVAALMGIRDGLQHEYRRRRAPWLCEQRAAVMALRESSLDQSQRTETVKELLEKLEALRDVAGRICTAARPVRKGADKRNHKQILEELKQELDARFGMAEPEPAPEEDAPEVPAPKEDAPEVPVAVVASAPAPTSGAGAGGGTAAAADSNLAKYRRKAEEASEAAEVAAEAARQSLSEIPQGDKAYKRAFSNAQEAEKAAKKALDLAREAHQTPNVREAKTKASNAEEVKGKAEKAANEVAEASAKSKKSKKGKKSKKSESEPEPEPEPESEPEADPEAKAALDAAMTRAMEVAEVESYQFSESVRARILARARLGSLSLIQLCLVQIVIEQMDVPDTSLETIYALIPEAPEDNINPYYLICSDVATGL